MEMPDITTAVVSSAYNLKPAITLYFVFILSYLGSFTFHYLYRNEL
mgnify:CR=1 FL=1|jgi:hypothetical protein